MVERAVLILEEDRLSYADLKCIMADNRETIGLTKGLSDDFDLLKSGTHKYISRKKVKGKWEYKYADDAHHSEVHEKGTKFQTGTGVTIPVTHRKQKTADFGSRFGQDIEPAGRYVNHGHLGKEGPSVEAGGYKVTTSHDTVTFKNPLVLRHGSTTGDKDGWKRRLSDQYGGKTGKALTEAIVKDGHDGIVTVDTYTHNGKTYKNTSEIVDLTHLKVEKSDRRLPPPPRKPSRARRPVNEHGHRDGLIPGDCLTIKKSHLDGEGSDRVEVSDNGTFIWKGEVFPNGRQLLAALTKNPKHHLTIRRYFRLGEK